MKDSNQAPSFPLKRCTSSEENGFFQVFVLSAATDVKNPHNDDLNSDLEMVTTQVDF